jgi:hypothetical protein
MSVDFSSGFSYGKKAPEFREKIPGYWRKISPAAWKYVP